LKNVRTNSRHRITMEPLDLVKLTPLMQLTDGDPKIVVGMVDGPIVTNHPDLADEKIQLVSGKRSSDDCDQVSSTACMHGTFSAGILSAKRESPAPAICPGCTLLVRPIFVDVTQFGNGAMPSATPEELAAGIIDSVEAGAWVVNLSVALAQLSSRDERELEEALDHAARLGVIVVAAAGNQGTLASSVITRHPWVLPVVGCDRLGRPVRESNLGSSIGRRGLKAPGEDVTSIRADGKSLMLGGTSVATPFVTGTIALLWSVFPAASAIEVKSAVVGTSGRRTTIVPPLLDAWAGYQAMHNWHQSRATTCDGWERRYLR
jgi:subtilisin family serine protease